MKWNENEKFKFILSKSRFPDRSAIFSENSKGTTFGKKNLPPPEEKSCVRGWLWHPGDLRFEPRERWMSTGKLSKIWELDQPSTICASRSWLVMIRRLRSWSFMRTSPPGTIWPLVSLYITDLHIFQFDFGDQVACSDQWVFRDVEPLQYGEIGVRELFHDLQSDSSETNIQEARFHVPSSAIVALAETFGCLAPEVVVIFVKQIQSKVILGYVSQLPIVWN